MQNSVENAWNEVVLKYTFCQYPGKTAQLTLEKVKFSKIFRAET